MPDEDHGAPKKYPNWSWAGAAVFMLAFFLGAGWATALIMSASARTPPIAGETGDLLNSIGGVLAGAITAYIGGHIATKRLTKKNDHEIEDSNKDE